MKTQVIIDKNDAVLVNLRRSILGVVSKKYKKTNNFTALLLSDALSILIAKDVGPQMNQLIDIEFELDVENGVVTSLSEVAVGVYDLKNVMHYEKIGLKESAIEDYIEVSK